MVEQMLLEASVVQAEGFQCFSWVVEPVLPDITFYVYTLNFLQWHVTLLGLANKTIPIKRLRYPS